jgi:hypothetical protein
LLTSYLCLLPSLPVLVSLFSPLLLSSPQKLYFCEYSLHFFKRRSQLLRHLAKCKLRHPPGDEIYRKDNISMFEVSRGQSGPHALLRTLRIARVCRTRAW